MEVNFLHHRDSKLFNADVDPDTTGETCIRGLIESKFIKKAPSSRPYGLSLNRTNKQILARTTMQEAGVVGGDSIQVLQEEQGA